MTDYVKAIPTSGKTTANDGYRMVELPGAWPVLGHTVRAIRDPLRFLRSLPAHGDLVKVRVGVVNAVVVCNPTLMAQMLRNDQVFPRGGEINLRQQHAAGQPFTIRQKADHRMQRRLITAAFHVAREPRYASRASEEVDNVLSTWRDGQVIDARDEMSRITLGVLFANLFDRNLPESAKSQYIHDVRTVFRVIMKHAFMPAVLTKLPTPENRRYERACRRLSQAAHKLVAEQQAGIANDDNLVAVLLSARDADATSPDKPVQLSAIEVHDNVLGFIYSGFHTTASTLSWTLHALSQRPDLQERLHAEIDSVLGDTPAAIDAFPKLILTRSVVTETLRHHSPAWLFSRSVATDADLGGHPIPAGTTIVWSPYMLHHRADFFPDPEHYDPDRWIDHGGTVQPTAGTYIPFSAGPRKCIAESFALTEATLSLVKIVSRWRVEPAPGPPVRPTFGMFMTPENLRLRLTARATRRRTPAPNESSSTGPVSVCPHIQGDDG